MCVCVCMKERGREGEREGQLEEVDQRGQKEEVGRERKVGADRGGDQRGQIEEVEREGEVGSDGGR